MSHWDMIEGQINGRDIVATSMYEHLLITVMLPTVNTHPISKKCDVKHLGTHSGLQTFEHACIWIESVREHELHVQKKVPSAV